MAKGSGSTKSVGSKTAVMSRTTTVDKNVEMFCEDLLNYAAGRPLKYLVDKKKGY